MKQTLLQLTQSILRSIKGEEVNSISDTAESLAVADIIKEAYQGIISDKDYPELYTLFELDASGDDLKPTLMTLPSGVIGLEWVKYDTALINEISPRYQEVRYYPLDDFLSRIHSMTLSATDVSSMSVTTGTNDPIDFNYRNNAHPSIYTSFDDNTLIFDSYDSSINSTLVKAKTLCYGLKEDSWSVADIFIPKLDSQQFNILLQEAKALAWMELKSVDNVDAKMKARKGKINAEKKKNRANYNNKWDYYTRYPNYGRK